MSILYLIRVQLCLFYTSYSTFVSIIHMPYSMDGRRCTVWGHRAPQAFIWKIDYVWYWPYHQHTTELHKHLYGRLMMYDIWLYHQHTTELNKRLYGRLIMYDIWLYHQLTTVSFTNVYMVDYVWYMTISPTYHYELHKRLYGLCTIHDHITNIPLCRHLKNNTYIFCQLSILWYGWHKVYWMNCEWKQRAWCYVHV